MNMEPAILGWGLALIVLVSGVVLLLRRLRKKHAQKVELAEYWHQGRRSETVRPPPSSRPVPLHLPPVPPTIRTTITRVGAPDPEDERRRRRLEEEARRSDDSLLMTALAVDALTSPSEPARPEPAPVEPFQGHGGHSGGAGASGTWEEPVAAPAPAPDPTPWCAPEPTYSSEPSYSSPDPTPSDPPPTNND